MNQSEASEDANQPWSCLKPWTYCNQYDSSQYTAFLTEASNPRVYLSKTRNKSIHSTKHPMNCTFLLYFFHWRSSLNSYRVDDTYNNALNQYQVLTQSFSSGKKFAVRYVPHGRVGSCYHSLYYKGDAVTTTCRSGNRRKEEMANRISHFASYIFLTKYEDKVKMPLCVHLLIRWNTYC